MLRRLLPFVLAALAAAAVAAPAATADPGDLFVVRAAHGTLERAGAPGRFALTLRAGGPVTSFTDRPRRRAGEQRLRHFVHHWKTLGFASDPPNAALVDNGAPKGRDVVVVTLTRPKLLAGGRAVRFRARRIKTADGALARYDARADARVSGRFTGASLFIDDAPVSAVQILWEVQGLPPGGVFRLGFRGATLTNAAVDAQLQAGSITDFTFSSPGVFSLSAGPSGMSGSFFTTVIPNGDKVTGTLSVTSGATVTAFPPTGPSVPLDSGPFSLPAAPG